MKHSRRQQPGDTEAVKDFTFHWKGTQKCYFCALNLTKTWYILPEDLNSREVVANHRGGLGNLAVVYNREEQVSLTCSWASWWYHTGLCFQGRTNCFQNLCEH